MAGGNPHFDACISPVPSGGNSLFFTFHLFYLFFIWGKLSFFKLLLGETLKKQGFPPKFGGNPQNLTNFKA